MTNTAKMTTGRPSSLVLPPLLATMVFCFALVLIQQHQADLRIAAAKEQTYKRNHAPLSSSSLKNIDTLQPMTVAKPSAAAGSLSSGIKTSAPGQPSRSSGSAVQSAVPNNQPAGVITTVKQPVTKTLNTLVP